VSYTSHILPYSTLSGLISAGAALIAQLLVALVEVVGFMEVAKWHFGCHRAIDTTGKVW
jgi:hypothetical protein